MSDRWLSADEIASYLGVTKDTVYTWVTSKGMPGHKVGRFWKFKLLRRSTPGCAMMQRSFVFRQRAWRRRSARMARPRKAAKSEPVAAAEDDGASTDEIDAIEDGKIFDYITGKPCTSAEKTTRSVFANASLALCSTSTKHLGRRWRGAGLQSEGRRLQQEDRHRDLRAEF